MKITFITPSPFDGGGGMREIARFDLQLSDEVRLYGLRLMQTREGRRLTYAPSSGGRRFATFAPALVDTITAAAISAFNDMGHVTANGSAQY
ncbi:MULTISPECIES: hypothetical protein [unclassified Bradyrhizobium]|uniref:hypothetical protein n=1 Tax=unclassified Bradyrhizobium TaxID=2631580 RepID=UPI0033918644